MRTLQEKYNGIQEGKFSKENFLADARKELPNLVTRFNGYDDAVQILKNRGMIQEAKKETVKEWSPYGSMAFSGEKEKEKEKAPLSSLEVGDLIYMQGVSGDNITVKDKRGDGTVGVGHPHNDKVSYQDGTKEVQVVRRANLKEANLGHNEISSIHQEGDSWIVTYRKDGKKEKVFKTEKEARDFEKTLSEAKLTKKSLTDYRYKPTNDMDKYPYEQILRGLRVELEGLGVQGTPTAEEYAKALAKVSKNLAKDSIFYTNQVAGVNPKVDLHDKMVTATAKNTVDTFNGMKKAELKEGFKKLIKKVLSESMGDMFGDEERAQRAANYEQPGEDEYDFYSDPENYKDEEEFELHGEDEADDISHPRGYEEASDEESFEDLYEITDTEADKNMVRKFMTMYETEPSEFEKLHKQAQVQAATTNDIKFKHLLSLINRAKAGANRAKAGALQSLANQDRYQASIEGMDEDLYEGNKSLSELLK